VGRAQVLDDFQLRDPAGRVGLPRGGGAVQPPGIDPALGLVAALGPGEEPVRVVQRQAGRAEEEDGARPNIDR
jgi:hypothetical protein